MISFLLIDPDKLKESFSSMSPSSRSKAKYMKLYKDLLDFGQAKIKSTDIIGWEFMDFLRRKGIVEERGLD